LFESLFGDSVNVRIEVVGVLAIVGLHNLIAIYGKVVVWVDGYQHNSYKSQSWSRNWRFYGAGRQGQ